MKSIFYAGLMVLSSLTVGKESDPNTIRLATTNWCPYACEHTQSGIAHEYVSYLLQRIGYRVEIQYYPWTRAIHTAQNGQSHGLLTAVPAEAPDMLFTQVPTMDYQVCFFSHNNNPWQYDTIEQLSSVTLGVLADYAYGEPVDSYLADSIDNPKVMKLSGDDGLQRLITLVTKGRIDAFVEDRNVVAWHQVSRGKKDTELGVSGCLLSQPFYLALSPKFSDAQSVIEKVEQQLLQDENKLYLKTVIKPKYLAVN